MRDCGRVEINCRYLSFTDYEDEDYEEGEENEGEEEPSEKPVEPTETTRREDNSVLVEESEPDVDPAKKDATESVEDVEEEDSNLVVEKIDQEVQETTTSTTTRAPVIDLCQVGNGGCDHNCLFQIEDNNPEGRVECSCFSGFDLNTADGRTCYGESLV